MNGDLRSRFAIYHAVGLLADTAKGLGEQILKDIPNVDWLALSDMRVILVHRPSRVNSEIVWYAVTESVPDLLNEVRQYIAEAGHGGKSSH